MTRPVFDAQMRRLFGLRFVPAALDTHWEALRDVPLTVLTAAVTRAQKTRADFPTPVELRQDADQVAHVAAPISQAEDRSTALDTPVEIPVPHAAHVLRVRSTWAYYCEDCSDTGWRSHWCGEPGPCTTPWTTLARCERHGEHGAHEYVARCGCCDTNQALVRKREAQRKFAESAGKPAHR